MSNVRVAFLDRDGTILVDKGYVQSLADCEFLPGAVAGMLALQAAGFQLAIVSNQSGVARGYFDCAAVEQLHASIREELRNAGVVVSAAAYCPHGPWDHCRCRKPKVGLIAQVADQLGKQIDFQASWTIGDKLTDVELGKRLQTGTALLKSSYWNEVPDDLTPDHIVESLNQAAEMITAIGSTE